jgi:thiol-disulfide isomerase/thioredoxin
MNPIHRIIRTCCAVAFLGCGFVTSSPCGARTAKEIDADLQQVNPEVARFPLNIAMDPKYRRSVHDQMLAPLQKKTELLRELLQVEPSNKVAILFRLNVDLAVAAVLGDDASAKSLDESAAGADAKLADAAKIGLIIRDWFADQSEAAQQTVLDRVGAMAKARPTDDALANALMAMAANRAASVKIADEAGTMIETQLKGPTAIRYRATPNRVGRPLIVSGTTVDGKSVSTLAFKGKVVMVDFWATWCPPCREELPHVIETYKKYHEQGLEMIAASNDTDRKELLRFLKENPDMKWPQLYGPSSTPSHWNSLTLKYGIAGIPTIYLIDRNGILRSMNGTMELDGETIPQLLAEVPVKK